jgi:NAD(P) transhydrogenase
VVPADQSLGRDRKVLRTREEVGDEAGMLKLLFDPETHKLLGVHALGQCATEIIHIGQAVLFYGGSVEYFRDMVFNYPTLAEAYKVAALDGLNKL